MKREVTLIIDGPDSETIAGELGGALEFLNFGGTVSADVKAPEAFYVVRIIEATEEEALYGPFATEALAGEWCDRDGILDWSDITDHSVELVNLLDPETGEIPNP